MQETTVCSIPFLKNKNIQKVFGKEYFHFVSDHHVYIRHIVGEDASTLRMMGMDDISNICEYASLQKPIWLEVLPLSKILWSHDLTILNAFSFVIYICDKKNSMPILQNLGNIYHYQFNIREEEEIPKYVFYDVDVVFK